MMRFAQSAMVGLVVIALAACTPTTGPASSPTPSPTVSASSPSPSPTSSPITAPSSASADPSSPSTWLITTAGVGSAQLGAPVSSMQQLTGWSIQDSCRWAAFWGDATLQLTAAGDSSQTDPVIAEVTVLGSTTGAQPHTASGIGLGSTEDEVRSAYPGSVDGRSTYGPWIRTGDPTQGAIYFTLFDDTRTVRQVTVTTRAQPSPEFCG